MQKLFTNFTWKNTPSTETALSAENLNKINNGLDAVDSRVVTINDQTIAPLQTELEYVKSEVQSKIPTMQSDIITLQSDVFNIQSQLEEVAIAENRHKDNLLSGVRLYNNSKGFLQLLHVTDVHNDLISLKYAVDILNFFPSIDGMILTGDVVSTSYSPTQLQNINKILEKCQKPYYPCIGNHDVNGCIKRDTLLYNNYIKQAVDKGFIEVPYENAHYYSKEFSTGLVQKVKLIVLDEFELPTETSSANIWKRAMSFKQLNWFISELNSVTASESVIVALHTPASGCENEHSGVATFPMTNMKDKMFSANDTSITSDYIWESYMKPVDLICQIINAFQTKASGSINVSFTTIAEGSFVLDYDFSKVASTNFLCFLGGHNHRDYIWKHKIFANQYNIMPVCSSGEDGQMQWTDMAKNKRGSNIAFTVETFDTTNKIIDLIRIGQDCGITIPNGKFEMRDHERLNIQE